MKANVHLPNEEITQQLGNENSWQTPFRRIVVGLESGDPEDKALRLASILAGDLSSHLYMVYSLPILPPAAPLSLYVSPDLLEHNLLDAKSDLDRNLKETGLFDSCTWELIVGFEDPIGLVLKVANEHDADLIVVGSHGRHGFELLLLGSISESVLERAECPVLVLGPECEVSDIVPPSILFATDLEQTGIRAAQYATTLAGKNNSKLIALHVLKEKAPAEGRQREWVEDHCREQLRLLLTTDVQTSRQGECVVAYGDPAQEILACAGLKDAGLIVVGVGNHGTMSDHSPWRTLTQILRGARCPVLNVSADSKWRVIQSRRRSLVPSGKLSSMNFVGFRSRCLES